MVEILGDSGKSVADLYDVRGSIVGVRQLAAGEVALVHEMGSTLFSERFGVTLRRFTTGAILQNVSWNVVAENLPATPYRVLAVLVFADANGRTQLASVAIRDPVSAREIPIWVWDTAADSDLVRVRMEDDGGGVLQHRVLEPLNSSLVQLPGMGTGIEQQQAMNAIAFRGVSTGFGAGTVTVTALVQIAFSHIGGIGSHGLPIPSW